MLGIVLSAHTLPLHKLIAYSANKRLIPHSQMRLQHLSILKLPMAMYAFVYYILFLAHMVRKNVEHLVAQTAQFPKGGYGLV